MPIINGEKYACDSCVKGHRVSNCNHHDRQLNHIAPKGRPIKQCEHCRVARKSKSHHAKCDCGNKKEKPKVELKKEEVGCCCHGGSKCICSNKTEGNEARLDKILKRSNPPVKSMPRLASNNSESTLTFLNNGHHKPVHRNNNLAHTSGAPYKILRPHTLHGVASFAQTGMNDLKDSIPRSSADDMFLLQNSSKFYSSSAASRSSSAENLYLTTNGEFNNDLLSFDAQKSLSSQAEASNEASDGLADSSEFTWMDTSLSTVAEDPFPLSTTSPTFPSEVDWAIPSAEGDFFSATDLPLLASQPSSNAQPISHSGESSYRSIPGMTTTGSSGAQSEIGDQFAIEGLWHDTVSLRDNPDSNSSSKWNSQANDSYESTYWPGTNLPMETSTDRKVIPRTLYSSSTGLSRSMTGDINCSSSPPSSTGTAVGINPENSARNSNQFENSNDQAIIIPTGDDTSDDWRWSIDNEPPAASGDVDREFGWLLDS